MRSEMRAPCAQPESISAGICTSWTKMRALTVGRGEKRRSPVGEPTEPNTLVPLRQLALTRPPTPLSA